MKEPSTTVMKTNLQKGSLMSGQPEEIKIYTTEELTDALYHAQEIMERCLFSFVLMDETARSIIQDGVIKGDRITIGVRRSDALSNYTSTLRTLASNMDMHVGIDDFEETDKGFSWTYKGMPIEVKVIKNKYTFMDNPDQIYYWGEIFKIPNSFNKYYSMRNLVR